MATPIKQFVNLLNESNIVAGTNSKNKIKYIRVKASLEDTICLLNQFNIPYENVSVIDYPVTGASRFSDFILKITWLSSDIILKTNCSGVTQKDLAPNKLGIENKLYTDAAVFKADILQGLVTSGASQAVATACTNIINAIENGVNITITDALLNPMDKSKITSDFGEVALAFSRMFNQGGSVFFPAASNHSDFDFYHNQIPISAKGNKGSSRYLIGGNKEIANHINELGDSNIEQMFKSWYKRDMYSVFTYAAPNCPEILWWGNKLNGFTADSILQYTLTHTWDQFVSDIKKSQNNATLGIPSENKNRATYEAGDSNPLLFALLTIWARYYNTHNSNEFNQIVCAMLKDSQSKIVFEFFNYDSNTGEILITNQKITKYSVWGIRYHGNATSSLNNYPALEGLK